MRVGRPYLTFVITLGYDAAVLFVMFSMTWFLGCTISHGM